MMVAIITQTVSMARTKGRHDSRWPFRSLRRSELGRRRRRRTRSTAYPRTVRRASACARCRSRGSRSCRRAGSRRVLIGVEAKRSGTRCTTLTQLPLAFCGGRIANCAPVPGAIEQILPRHSRPGKVSIVTVAGWPGAHIGEIRFLRVAVDPEPGVGDDGEHGLPRGRDAAEFDLVDLRRLAGDRRRRPWCCSSCAQRPPPGPWPGCSRGRSRSKRRARRRA